jgi:CspA family cold shock protein
MGGNPPGLANNGLGLGPDQYARATVAPREQRSREGRFKTMATGTIRTLRDRGFGFIEPDGDSGSGELFFHHSAVANRGFEMLQVGQRVSFDVTPDPRDPGRQRAINVVPEDGDQ